MDQKQMARMNEQLMKQRRELARLFAEGKVAVLDRFAAPIVKGSLVMWRLNTDLVFQVDDVKVDLRPSAQPGAMLMQLSVVVPDVLALANQPIMYMTRVGHTDGVAHSSLESPDATAQGAVVEPVPPVPPVDEADQERAGLEADHGAEDRPGVTLDEREALIRDRHAAGGPGPRLVLTDRDDRDLDPPGGPDDGTGTPQ